MSEQIGNAVDFGKLAEIDQLLANSDAGNIEYDKDGNAIFDEDAAEQKAKEQRAAAETESKGESDESQAAQDAGSKETETQTDEQKASSESEDVEGEPEDDELSYDSEIEIPMPDGRQTLTLGELKDRFVALSRERESVVKQAESLQVERLIVNEILANPGQVSPERIEQLKSLNKQQRDMDIRTIAQMFPQWAENPHKRAADFGEMLRAGARLGATEMELKSITRPWMINMLKTVSDYMARERRALKAMKAPGKGRTAKGKTPKRVEPEARNTSFEQALTGAKGNLEGADWAALDSALR